MDDETADTLDGDEKPASFEDSVVGQELGPVVFEMSYADAILRGVLPPFHVVHYGLFLSSEERGRYDYLSKQIKELRAESGSRRGLALVRWCRSRAAAQNPGAAQFLALTGERKRLLYRISERNAAVEEIFAGPLLKARKPRLFFSTRALTRSWPFSRSFVPQGIRSLPNTVNSRIRCAPNPCDYSGRGWPESSYRPAR